MRILIVDDNALMLRTTTRLVARGFPDAKLVTCGSPQEALKQLAEDAFDLVLSDYEMPKMNGLRFLTAVAQQWPATVRVLTTSAERHNLEGAPYWDAAQHYIRKPYSRRKLCSLIQEAING